MFRLSKHFNYKLLIICLLSYILHFFLLSLQKIKKTWGCADSIGILIKIINETEIASFVNGGPYKTLLCQN